MIKTKQRDFKPRVWVNKETGQLWEYFYSVLGPALTKIELVGPGLITNDIPHNFMFNDDDNFKPKNFEDLGLL